MAARDGGLTLPEALERLGLDRRASLADARKAYRRLSLKHHPDLFQDPGEKLAAHRRFLKIRDAYEFLRKHPELLRGARPAEPAADDPVAARIDAILRRYRELHSVRPSPAADLLRRVLDGIPAFFVWLLFGGIVAALLMRPAR